MIIFAVFSGNEAKFSVSFKKTFYIYCKVKEKYFNMFTIKVNINAVYIIKNKTNKNLSLSKCYIFFEKKTSLTYI